jgi:glycosyltransferase involved in cell wall biosynthesis
MPVYNGEAFIREAIDSILSQSFSDFEFLIIDDGSTDASVEIIGSYAEPRIHLVQNGKRLGLVESLNEGFELARGEYVARMDCDDISLPQRLARQVTFLDGHAQVGLCGTWVKTIGEAAGDVWRYPTDPEIIRCRLLFESVIAHPSVMMRRRLFGKAGLSYNPLYTRAQDYELWVRSAKTFALANIAPVLLIRRVHSDQVGTRDRAEQRQSSMRIRMAQIEELGIRPTKLELELHQSLSMWEFRASEEFIMRAEDWLQKLRLANMKSSLYPEPAFSQVLGERWFAICSAAAQLGRWTFDTFWRSPLSRAASLSWKNKLKLLVKTSFAACGGSAASRTAS